MTFYRDKKSSKNDSRASGAFNSRNNTDKKRQKEKKLSKTITFRNGGLNACFNKQRLEQFKKTFQVNVSLKGNNAHVNGQASRVHAASSALQHAMTTLEEHGEVSTEKWNDIINNPQQFVDEEALPTKRSNGRIDSRSITPRSENQGVYLANLQRHEFNISVGPAGTGKTYLAVAHAVTLLKSGKVDKLVFARPAKESGEKMGAFPGGPEEKVGPYLRPIYDALAKFLGDEQVGKLIENGVIEMGPLELMRGRTFDNAFTLLDEAQNTTPEQMKMFLTRKGENCYMVIDGDHTQKDLRSHEKSGLTDFLEVYERHMKGNKKIGFVAFTEQDVVRDDLVKDFVIAYGARDKAKQASPRPHNS